MRLMIPLRLPDLRLRHSLPIPSPTSLSKIRMRARLLRTDPRRRIIHQQRIQQIQALLTQPATPASISYQRDLLVAYPFRKAGFEVREAGDAGPFCFGGRAENAEDFEDFVDFGVAGEEGFASAHFGEDAADGPHVHAGAVGAAAEQDLGSAVPEGYDLG